MDNLIKNELFINKYNYFLKSDNPSNNEKNKISSKNHKSVSKQKKIRVLIVEDEIVTLNTLADILREKQYEVITASNGFMAIEKIKDKDVHIAIIDIKLPLLDGVKTFKILKKKYPNIKGIMMTAYSASAQIQRVKDAGALTCIAKPFDIDELLTFIKDYSCEEKN